MRRLNHAEDPETADKAARRQELQERLTRARDLYELGDLPRPEYIARRDAILDHARQVLEDFAIFWLDDHRVVAVQPKPSFLPLFQ